MKNNETVKIGVIADDFTGASDAASFLQKGGLSTVLVNGVPGENQAFSFNHYQAIVVALKTRTAPVKEAVEESLRAASWLEEQGVNRFFDKYCSTMDSTAEGNIGPILDALIERKNAAYVIVSPALPINGRTVRKGHLYVHGVPLDESPMRNHPLTPMWTSDIAKIMEPQGKYDSFVLSRELLSKKDDEINDVIEKFGEDRESFYLIPDFENEEDSKRIVELFGKNTLLSGGTGFLEDYAQSLTKQEESNNKSSLFGSATEGPAVILAGSVSEATRLQVSHYKSQGGNYYEIDPLALIDGKQSSETIWNELKGLVKHQKDFLIYSAHEPDAIKKAQAYGKIEVGDLIEKLLSDIAELSFEAGYNRIIVAGGETSGAITQRLDFANYAIEESVAPGVPIMVPLQNKKIRLVLKSGNFGEEDFFERAIELTKKYL